MRIRVKYPNRTRYFAVETGLLDRDQEADRIEQERIERARDYQLLVAPIEAFKEEFHIE